MKFCLTTIAWVEALAKKEIIKCGWKIEEVNDRIITFSGWEELISRVNLWSRVWNKLYILLSESENITNFDDFFEKVENLNLKKYFKNNPILVKASSSRSELFATQTIQKLGKKAIINSLVWKWKDYFEDESKEAVEIFFLLVDNKLRVLLNTSGEALHKRWYRLETSVAPIKESLAAALVLLSNWRFRENFYDPFCGSWTIVIEALMIAKNIAPWLKRDFAFEKLWLLDKEIIEKEKEDARKKEFSGKYNIFASDIDSEMIEIARQNAKNAWLSEWEINFSNKDFMDLMWEKLSWTLVSNPPYGERMKPENIKSIYNNIDKLFRLNPDLNWWIISSFMEFDDLIKAWDYKKRKLYNWWEMCYFWKKK